MASHKEIFEMPPPKEIAELKESEATLATLSHPFLAAVKFLLQDVEFSFLFYEKIGYPLALLLFPIIFIKTSGHCLPMEKLVSLLSCSQRWYFAFQGTFGTVWRHFFLLLTQMVSRAWRMCCWHLVGRD